MLTSSFLYVTLESILLLFLLLARAVTSPGDSLAFLRSSVHARI